MLPLALIYYISTVAETNRPPFDLVEAESELVAGFFTEYSAGPFVFFFLAEYSNIILMCASTIILFLGGYLYPISLNNIIPFTQYTYLYYLMEGILYGLSIGIKLNILMFSFI
jgi:NADH:ubiquinone oxidoreductase subunit H